MDNNEQEKGKGKEIGWVCQETTTVSREIGWKQNVLDGNNSGNGDSVSGSNMIDEKPRKMSASNSSSNDSSSSSDSCDSKDEKRRARKLKKEEKRERRREKRKVKKEEKMQKREMKKSKKEERKKLKKLKKLGKKSNEESSSDFSIPIDLMIAKVRSPETPEEYAARQSRIRREIDPATGRSRLIKGDGEIIEEIVSRERHLEINRQVNRNDGEYFQAKTIGK